MGGAISFIADPLNILTQEGAAKLLDPIGGDPLGISKVFARGDAPSEQSLMSKVAGEFAAANAAAIAAQNAQNAEGAMPFRRAVGTPDSAEAQKTDRRRSMASALRRRSNSSILTSSTPAGETLGG